MFLIDLKENYKDSSLFKFCPLLASNFSIFHHVLFIENFKISRKKH